LYFDFDYGIRTIFAVAVSAGVNPIVARQGMPFWLVAAAANSRWHSLHQHFPIFHFVPLAAGVVAVAAAVVDPVPNRRLDMGQGGMAPGSVEQNVRLHFQIYYLLYFSNYLKAAIML
jgi:hypothetical protein